MNSSFNTNPISRTTINFSILDTLLIRCRKFMQFSQILGQMVSTGFIKDTYAASRILKFSTDSNFIHINYSHNIFCHIENPNGFIWNTMLRAFVQRNQAQDSIFLYKSMLKKSFLCIDNFTYPILIQGCSVEFAEFEGRELHDHVVKMGFDCDVYVVNNLIYMYSVCGKVSGARRMFDESPVLDSVSWNSMLAGYVLSGSVEEAMLMYNKMPKKNVISSNSMIVLLGKKGRVSEAYQLFNEMEEKDLVSWTALISCYEQNGMYEEALDLLVNMYHNGVKVDEVVAVSVLSACANLLNLGMGESIHGLFTRVGLDSYVNLQNALIFMYLRCGDVLAAQKLFDTGFCLDLISWNSMISGYLKCGLVKKARELFDTMPERDLVSWSAMISGYTQLDRYQEALALFNDMQHDGIKPDETILVSVISSCAHLAALDQGKWIDAYIRKNELKVNTILGTTLIDMYMKCGCVENAMQVFNGLEERGTSSWNAVILGFAMNGQVERSLEFFEEMKKCVVPNEITFVAVLGACRHVGLVGEGRQFFDSMVKVYNIEPNIKHYGCMVDLLGRAVL
ncbi:pentatricopeptide repeat-containing protein At2g22410, mitochondrial-like, partial [Olea europaea var. sylvestris]|uniref:pentatricopeptide repeat-containing protein At2g22410, mitochondrial-like n=1 Tax=Olea europaea var. sylvestris TaxID=158386 RepID=UPI000C1D81C2